MSLAIGLFITQFAFAQPPIWIEGVRLVDGRGDHGIHDVLIANGHIEAFDPPQQPVSARVIDGHGKTLIPGLIDSHVHLHKHPASAWTTHDPEQTTRLHHRYLRSYLAFGVTTVLDPGITPGQTRTLRALAGPIGGPDIQVVGPLLGPHAGYPSAVFPDLSGITDPSEIGPRMDAFLELDSIGVKVTMENGQLQRIWPLFPKPIRQHIVEEARARDLPLYVHAMDPQMTRLALKMTPHALAHAPTKGGRSLVNQLKASGVYVHTTLDILAGVDVHHYPEFWSQPSVQRALDPNQHRVLLDPQSMERTLREGLAIYAPRTPKWMQNAMFSLVRRSIPRRVRRAMRVIADLHNAGVPLVVASDSGGSPIVAYLPHGPSTILEMLFLEEAGLSRLDVLRAATISPARMMGLPPETGTLQVGAPADLVLLNGNPLEDLRTLITPELVVSNGIGKSPEEWLAPLHEGIQGDD